MLEFVVFLPSLSVRRRPMEKKSWNHFIPFVCIFGVVFQFAGAKKEHQALRKRRKETRKKLCKRKKCAINFSHSRTHCVCAAIHFPRHEGNTERVFCYAVFISILWEIAILSLSLKSKKRIFFNFKFSEKKKFSDDEHLPQVVEFLCFLFKLSRFFSWF